MCVQLQSLFLNHYPPSGRWISIRIILPILLRRSMTFFFCLVPLPFLFIVAATVAAVRSLLICHPYLYCIDIYTYIHIYIYCYLLAYYFLNCNALSLKSRVRSLDQRQFQEFSSIFNDLLREQGENCKILTKESVIRFF